MKIVVNRWLPPKGYSAMSFCGLLLTRSKKEVDGFTYNHENIHWQQQKELLIVFFFLWYGIEYMLRLMRTGSHSKAYRNICFEREAYANEKNIGYVWLRRRWAWHKYL